MARLPPELHPLVRRVLQGHQPQDDAVPPSGDAAYSVRLGSEDPEIAEILRRLYRPGDEAFAAALAGAKASRVSRRPPVLLAVPERATGSVPPTDEALVVTVHRRQALRPHDLVILPSDRVSLADLNGVVLYVLELRKSSGDVPRVDEECSALLSASQEALPRSWQDRLMKALTALRSADVEQIEPIGSVRCAILEI